MAEIHDMPTLTSAGSLPALEPGDWLEVYVPRPRWQRWLARHWPIFFGPWLNPRIEYRMVCGNLCESVAAIGPRTAEREFLPIRSTDVIWGEKAIDPELAAQLVAEPSAH